MRFRIPAFAALSLAATALPAVAQPPPGNRPPPNRGVVVMFELADRDRDGRVTLTEAWGFVEAGFAAADADRDGALTPDEMANFRPDRPPAAAADRPGRRGGDAWQAPLFRGLDASRDRRLQLEELRPLIEALFRAGDANGDDALTRNEIPGGR